MRTFYRHKQSNRATPHTMRGFTLVELMISLVLGLLVIAGVGSVFVANKQSYRTNEALGQVQDASRIAYEFMARDIRMAGYGNVCSNFNFPINVIADPAPAADFGLITGGIKAIEGSVAAAGAAVGGITVKTGTGIVQLDYFPTLDNSSPNLVGNLPPNNANIQINENTPGFVAGDTLFITDCTQADVFRASTVSSGTKTITIAHASNVNTDNKLSKSYGGDAFVFDINDYRRITYFIGQRVGGANPQYSLYRKINADTPVELVRGVTDMQVGYHQIGSSDYVTAVNGWSAADWSNVDAVQISYQVESDMRNVTTDGNPLTRTFTTTVAIRNRLPG